MLPPAVAIADAVEIDGIYYNLSSEVKQAEVTINPNDYTGDIVIPEKVTYEGSDYEVTSIGLWAFRLCSNLTSVTISNSVTSIGDAAFERTSLTSVNIPNSVTSIGESAFSTSFRLTSVTIGNSVTSIGESAFSFCLNLTSVTIGNSVTSIGNSAFWWCSSLTSVTIPNSVTSIGSNSFEHCTSLTTVSIPNSVANIEFCAFEGCSKLACIIIPNSVTNIEDMAFGSCTSLNDVYCYAESVPNTSFMGPFDSSSIANATLHVPAVAVDAYKADSHWSGFKSIVALTDDDPKPTGIASVNISENEDGVYYDLRGGKLLNPGRGIYIQNGKKVILKSAELFDTYRFQNEIHRERCIRRFCP